MTVQTRRAMGGMLPLILILQLACGTNSTAPEAPGVPDGGDDDDPPTPTEPVVDTLSAQWDTISDWTSYQRDPQHTGYVPVVLDPSTFSFRWAVKLEETVSNPQMGQVVTLGEMAFTASSQPSQLFALDPSTGEVIWSRYFEGATAGGHPSIIDGRIYLTTGIQDAAALWTVNPTDGTSPYATHFESQSQRYFAPVGSDGVVVSAGTLYGGVNAFSETTGEVLWSQPLGEVGSWWTPAVDEDRVYHMAGGNGASLKVFALHTGEEVVDVRLPQGCRGGATPTAVSATAVLVNTCGLLARVDVTAAKVVWASPERQGLGLAVANGRVYSPTATGVQALDLETGDVAWSWPLPEGSFDLRPPMLVTRNLLFVGAESHTYALDLDTHQVVWDYPAGGYLSLNQGILYVATPSGAVHAIHVDG